MRRQKVLKKLIASLIMTLIVLGEFSMYRFESNAGLVDSEAKDKLLLTLSETNENDEAYGINGGRQNGKIIWNIASKDSNGNKKYSTNLYCIKAEYGETWATKPGDEVEYDKSYAIPLNGATESEVANTVLSTDIETKNAILWVIDHMLIPGESSEENFLEYLKDAGIISQKYDNDVYSYTFSNVSGETYLPNSNEYYETVTAGDIVAIQQAVLWYFTNDGKNGSVYNQTEKSNWLYYAKLKDGAVTNYDTLYSNSNARGEHSTVIYNYLVNAAKNAVKELNGTEYQLKNSTAKLWISTTADEQPVIEVHKLPEVPEKIFDLSLRKAIVSVQDKDGNNKNIVNAKEENATRALEDKDGSIKNVDVSTLTSGTTATYNHRKDPVVVEQGDKVTYSITIYNEGEEAGYATKIVDQLPGTWNKGLRLENKYAGEITSSTGNKYKLDYGTETNTITLELISESPVALEAYNAETKELQHETITLTVIVEGKADTVNSKVLTNIAYIEEEYNKDQNVIIKKDTKQQDRDSQTWISPNKLAAELVTAEIGYTGDLNNSEDLGNNSYYYKGEQDDDDFEKVVILPETFDLSLRKNITKVNGTAIAKENDRTPDVNLKPLDEEGKTTASYNHRKDPVKVQNGSTVEYNISVYNEGTINGIATIIKDQLPTGLKLNIENNKIFRKEGENYFVTSTKGNVYKVSYDETNNLVVFELTSANPTILQAHISGHELDKDVISLEGKVDCKADADENVYLTNIAYIYTAKQEDGTIVTNQKSGDPEADRDSEPYTYPDKKADELKTVGNVGYTGKTENPTDLAQNVYYKGEQDDDDFEKLVILPETFDLSLRKYITNVDGKEVVNTRNPNINITNLDNGSSTTATYNHRKDPVKVQNGSTVEYNISIYNEGSINGVATIIKDQLPTGLKPKMTYFDIVSGQYVVNSKKGNTYKVEYDETNNVLTFTLDETRTVKQLTAHATNQKLDEDVITLQCTVDCNAHENQNIYLTNIAYIYTAKQEDGTVITNQETGTEADRDSEPYTYPGEKADELKTVGNIGYTGNSENATDLAQNVYYKGEQDDDDFEKLVIEPKEFDLKLIKFITELNGEETGNRVLSVDTSKLNKNGVTTAEYIMQKNPVAVKAGDFVTYTLRVYNEGAYDGYATEISEDIPNGLEFIAIGDGTIWSWDGQELKVITEEIKKSEMYDQIVEINSNWGYSEGSSIIKTRALSEELIQAFGKENAEYTDKENNIDYKEVQVIFRVKENVEPKITIRNEAAISQDKVVDEFGKEIEIPDRDSTPDEWKKEESGKHYDEDKKWPIYKEDDEDYDNIVTKAFDLSLRKQIIQINDVLYTQRFAELDKDGTYSNTLYNYYNVYNNKPKVKAGDEIIYSIRVYNEGEIDGYASLIVDELPSGIEFVSSIYKGIDYGWELVEGTEKTYQTDYLSYENDSNKGTSKSTILKAYTGEGEASYKEIYIVCKVKEDVTKEDKLLNVAQIAEDSDENGNPIKDKDSVPGKTDNEEKWKVEDDLDIEIVELQEFDLALRKFITGIENGENYKEVTTRIPKVSYDSEARKIVYTHPKDALVVHVGDTVIYTLRVYNEGDIDGYASEVKDDIPEYLEYLPEHNLNIENQWVMYDEEGKVTEDVAKAVCIRTIHLAKGEGAEKEEGSKNANLIKAFDSSKEISEENPDYKELQIAFKVKDPNSTEYEIVNFAQISEDTDKNGDPIKDKDSVPDNGEDEPKEDDEDIEKVKVEYFDLSLLKYVTRVYVNENGQEKVIKTGNVGDEKDIIPHVQIDKKNINKTTVKFAYTIKITNEGQIAGEATEITDYVPQGLVFKQEDNPNWTDEGNNVISTKQLEKTTLKPGESAEVEVILTWINGDNNLGPKTNIAEISEDHNEEDVPDIDSTPDNKKDGEDDIDEATVLLSVKQGGGIQSIYFNLGITFLVIILIGGVLIKKFVL